MCSAFNNNSKCDVNSKIFSATDLTIYKYPFLPKDNNVFNNKSSNSKDFLQSYLTTSVNEESHITSAHSISILNSNDSDNENKLKEKLNSKHKPSPSAICWWKSSVHKSLEIAIIGFKNGDIIFVNLNSGIKIKDTTIKGEIKDLFVCEDLSNQNVFLFVSFFSF